MHSLLTTNQIIELTLSTGIPLERSFQTRSQEPYNGHRTPPAFLIVYPSTPGLPIYSQQPLLHCYTQQSHTILCSLQPALPALVQNNDAAEKGATLHLLLFSEKKFLSKFVSKFTWCHLHSDAFVNAVWTLDFQTTTTACVHTCASNFAIR